MRELTPEMMATAIELTTTEKEFADTVDGLTISDGIEKIMAHYESLTKWEALHSLIACIPGMIQTNPRAAMQLGGEILDKAVRARIDAQPNPLNN